MRVLGVALAGVLTLSATVTAHSASLGSNLGQAMTGPTPGAIQVGNGNGSNWHPEVAPFQWTVCQLAVYVLVMAACVSAS